MALIEWDLPSRSRGGNNRMADNEISLNYIKGKNYSLTFNQTISKVAESRGLKYLMIGADTDTGELIIILNNKSGVKLHAAGKECKNLSISSKEWIEKLLKYFGKPLAEQRFRIIISGNLSVVDDKLTFRIRK